MGRAVVTCNVPAARRAGGRAFTAGRAWQDDARDRRCAPAAAADSRVARWPVTQRRTCQPPAGHPHSSIDNLSSQRPPLHPSSPRSIKSVSFKCALQQVGIGPCQLGHGLHTVSMRVGNSCRAPQDCRGAGTCPRRRARPRHTVSTAAHTPAPPLQGDGRPSRHAGQHAAAERDAAAAATRARCGSRSSRTRRRPVGEQHAHLCAWVLLGQLWKPAGRQPVWQHQQPGSAGPRPFARRCRGAACITAGGAGAARRARGRRSARRPAAAGTAAAAAAAAGAQAAACWRAGAVAGGCARDGSIRDAAAHGPCHRPRGRRAARTDAPLLTHAHGLERALHRRHVRVTRRAAAPPGGPRSARQARSMRPPRHAPRVPNSTGSSAPHSGPPAAGLIASGQRMPCMRCMQCMRLAPERMRSPAHARTRRRAQAQPLEQAQPTLCFSHTCPLPAPRPAERAAPPLHVARRARARAHTVRPTRYFERARLPPLCPAPSSPTSCPCDCSCQLPWLTAHAPSMCPSEVHTSTAVLAPAVQTRGSGCLPGLAADPALPPNLQLPGSVAQLSPLLCPHTWPPRATQEPERGRGPPHNANAQARAACARRTHPGAPPVRRPWRQHSGPRGPAEQQAPCVGATPAGERPLSSPRLPRISCWRGHARRTLSPPPLTHRAA